MCAEDGKKGEIAFSSHRWDSPFSVCPCQCYSKQLELEKEVECANSTSHIARPCPSAAGDYMDYGMIRTPPPLPPPLPGFTLDLNTQRKVLTSEERPPVSPPSLRKSVVFPLRPELHMSDPSVNYRSAEQRGVSWKGQAGVLCCTLAEAETWGYWRHSGAQQCFTSETLHQFQSDHIM